jgi:hypothetical protein
VEADLRPFAENVELDITPVERQRIRRVVMKDRPFRCDGADRHQAGSEGENETKPDCFASSDQLLSPDTMPIRAVKIGGLPKP